MLQKETIYNECKKMVEERVENLKNVLKDLRESAANETKSTAGDKHETALAMLQIEQANTAKQLDEALLQKQQLDKIDLSIISLHIILGSLIKTNLAYLFISSALGKIKIDETDVIALSPLSPLGAKLLRKRVGDMVEMNGKEYVVEKIE